MTKTAIRTPSAPIDRFNSNTFIEISNRAGLLPTCGRRILARIRRPRYAMPGPSPPPENPDMIPGTVNKIRLRRLEELVCLEIPCTGE